MRERVVILLCEEVYRIAASLYVRVRSITTSNHIKQLREPTPTLKRCSLLNATGVQAADTNPNHTP